MSLNCSYSQFFSLLCSGELSKHHSIMKRQFLLTSLGFLFSFFAMAQSPATFTSGSTAAQLATQIGGPGLTITNPVITHGIGSQVGTFSNGFVANLQIDTGVLLTTSTVTEAFTNNNNIGISLGPNSNINDPDLTAINPLATHDVVVYEFDVTLDAVATVITVDFQFAADEYPTYVGSQFNDVFGFFVSGPGIVGNENIAKVPGKTTIIAVNNINNGTLGSNQDGTPADLTNSFYYIANSNNTGAPNNVVYSEFNGFTKVIRAIKKGLTPNTTYHVKLAISDVADNQFDSGVFIKLITGFQDNDFDGIRDEIDLDDDNDGILDSIEGVADTDGDGIIDSFDLDADGDGIPDNIEAQSTLGYIAPGTFSDANNDGVNDIYAGGLTPVNTDGIDNPDYKDTDSDNDGINDTIETNLNLSGLVGLNGLDNNIDTVDYYTDVNGSLNFPSLFPDGDGDLNFGGDVDYRDATFNFPDTDGDGVPNDIDLDDDNDGILDTVEGALDTDGDVIIDSSDLDSDGDGIPDNIEAQSTLGYIAPGTFTDANNDGVNDIYAGGLTPVNTDGADTPDYKDTDSDNDGITDTVEANITLSGVVGVNGLDNNRDTVDDYTDVNGILNNPSTLPDADMDVNTGGDVDYRDNLYNPADNDGDGIPNTVDIDDDNDGILDSVEGSLDTDSDGIKDSFDLDADNDGIPDNIEAQSTLGYIAPSLTDSDGNGLDDAYEVTPGSGNGLTPPDTDGDLANDYKDTDADNDGISDTNEANLNLSGIVGVNGLDNNIDTVDDYTDVNGSLNFPTFLPDSDGDLNSGGDVDYRDATNSILDNDGDGIPDNIDLDDDNDGILDSVEGGLDADGDGIKNSFDLDSDGDGIPDNVEAQTTAGYMAPGIFTDANNDGVNDVYAGGFTPVNTDGLDTPDYLDLDSDNQGNNDTSEAGLTLSGIVGTNGLDNAIDTIDDYTDVNGIINNPSVDLPNSDALADVDYRDPTVSNTPGGVLSSFLLWLRADKDVTGTTSVTNWDDQSGFNNHATVGVAPSKISNGINFNPSILFNGSQWMRIVGGIFKTSAVTNVWTYTVVKQNLTRDSYFIRENLASGQFYLRTPMSGGIPALRYRLNGSNINAPNSPTQNIYNLWSLGTSTGLTGPSGTRKAIYKDGLLFTSSNTSSNGVGNNSVMYIGSQSTSASRRLQGEIAEVIVMTAVPTAAEKQRIETYLAIKYGITLNPTDNNATVIEGDYIAADGITKIWDYTANTAFHNNVTAIGRDNLKGVLNQKQSISINADALVTIGLGTIAADNASNANNFLANNYFLTWGHNGTVALAATTSTLMCSPEKTLNRTWKIVETGTVGTVQIAATAAIINTHLNTANTLKLLKIADDAALTTNVIYLPLTLQTINGVSHYAASFDFNGTKYFTYTELNAIIWSGNTASWAGGTGVNGAPSASDTGKLLLIDAQSSLTNGFINAAASVNCAWIKTGSKLVVNNTKSLTVLNQIQLDGELRMIGNAQLVQSHVGVSQVTGTGKIFIDQLGTTTSVYQYNYWSSPVVEVGLPTYRVMNVLKDGSIPTSETSTPLNINFIDWDGNFSSLDGSKTSPISLSNFWIFTLKLGNAFSNWEHVWENGPLAPPIGFLLKGPGVQQNYTFMGTPNDGDISTPIVSGDLILIGNPYPSALDATKFLNDNSASIVQTLYFWEMQGDSGNHNLAGYVGGYGIRNLTMGVAANTNVSGTAGLGNGTYHAPGRYIPVAQGFFVGSSNGGTITFNNSQRFVQAIDGTNSFFFKTKKEDDTTLNQTSKSGEILENNAILSSEELDATPQVKIGFEYQDPDGKDLHRQIGINFKDGNTDVYDNGYDSWMFDKQPTDMYVKFASDTTKYIIAGVGKFENITQIPLIIEMANAGTVNIMLDESAMQNVTVFLRDITSRRFFNLSKNVVSLTLDAGIYQDRFFVTFGNESTLGVDDLALNQVLVYFDNNSSEVVVRKNNLSIQNATLFNVLGQKTYYWKAPKEGDEIRLPVKGVSNGIYMININTDKGTVSKKLFINN